MMCALMRSTYEDVTSAVEESSMDDAGRGERRRGSEVDRKHQSVAPSSLSQATR